MKTSWLLVYMTRFLRITTTIAEASSLNSLTVVSPEANFKCQDSSAVKYLPTDHVMDQLIQTNYSYKRKNGQRCQE